MFNKLKYANLFSKFHKTQFINKNNKLYVYIFYTYIYLKSKIFQWIQLEETFDQSFVFIDIL